MKQRIQSLLNKINRPGIDKLQAYLEGSDYYSAPASTKYHDAELGGLAKHSLQVYENLVTINSVYNLKLSDETIIICSLGHDICKVNFYKQDVRNTKQDGVWVQVPYYTVEDKFPFGHGEKSVYILNEFIHLSVEEAMAIRWHMGLGDCQEFATRQAISAATEKYPIVLALQMADMMAAAWGDKFATAK